LDFFYLLNFRFFHQVICELIDQQHHGIMALLDEACLNVGNTTDPMLLEHMDKRLKTNQHYASRASDATTKKKNLELHQVKRKKSIQPNLPTTATLGTPKKRPLFKG
jgi:hypothetical protein